MCLRVKKQLGLKSQTKKRDYHKKFIFVFEGEKTEKTYFEQLSNSKQDLGITDLIYIEILDKKDETKSNQLNVVKTLDSYIKNTLEMKNSSHILKNYIEEFISENFYENKESLLSALDNSFKSEDSHENIINFIDSINEASLDFEDVNCLEQEIESLKSRLDYADGLDSVCIIIDRDKGSFKDFQYDQVLDICNSNNYVLGISNPCFEFWLLLHLTDAKEYDSEKIRLNKRISNSKNAKKYVESKVAEKLNGSYNKSKLCFDKFKDKIDTAIENQKLYETDPINLKDNIGTNIGNIINQLREGI